MTNAVLAAEGIFLDVTASSRKEAVLLCGKHLLELGAITEPYIEKMWERELILSSYVGETVAIPHGTEDSRQYVNFAQLVFIRFKEPIDWDGEVVNITVGIASANNEHVDILAALADILLDEEKKNLLLQSKDKNQILELMGSVG